VQEPPIDEIILNSLGRALDEWIEGNGIIGNFITEIFHEAKLYYATPNAEWRGAVVIYIVAGTEVNLTIELKLLFLDCVSAWEERVKSDAYMAKAQQMHLLSMLVEFRNYANERWNTSVQWCKELMNEVIGEKVREKFWIEAGKIQRPPIVGGK
jgi:hypothetical protein